MRFRNYRNRFNKTNRIYSDEDIRNMTLASIFHNENDILAQNREIGIPTLGELQNSPNAIWIESYQREDGTQVEGHWRSLPDGNNTGNASNIDENNTNSEQNLQDKKLYPDEIAGVKQGKPMSFEEASGVDINPNLYEDSSYMNNCQSCVVAYEARRRGYDVQAVKQTGKGKINELAYRPFGAWFDNETKKPCEGEIIEVNNGKECFDYLNNEIKKGERYAFTYYNIQEIDGVKKIEGHIVALDRNKNEKLRLYDPQSNSTREDSEIIDRLDALADFSDKLSKPIMLRIDNKEFNPYYIHEVVRKRY